MIVAYILFILFPQNLALVYVALVLFYTPNTFIQMTAILALTDSIEYGQLKTGQRNEAVTLSVRPMLDKIAGALSNSIVGVVAVAAAMTNGADPNSLTAQNIHAEHSDVQHGCFLCATGHYCVLVPRLLLQGFYL